MKRALVLVAILFSSNLPFAKAQSSRVQTVNTIYSLTSPNRAIVAKIGVTNGNLYYTLGYNNKQILEKSMVSLLPINSTASSFFISGAKRSNRNEIVEVAFGERKSYPNNYNEIELVIGNKANSKASYGITFRLFNEGFAFQYSLPKDQGLEAISETTEFSFTAPPQIYTQNTHGYYAGEREYKKGSLSALKDSTEIPLLVEGDGFAAAINEAANINFPRALLRRHHVQTNTLQVVFADTAVIKKLGGAKSPWRVVMLAKSPSDLIHNNYLLYALSPPNAIGASEWIKPGKLIRDVSLSTEGSLRCIDFAKKMNFQYVMFDAGWYGLGYGMGNEHNPKSDASKIVSKIDMPRLISYGKENGIGIILYVNYVAMRSQLDSLLPMYRKWGVAGLKYGFVDGRTSTGIAFVHEAVAKAAKFKFVVDIHDAYRPTGLSRTYPNLLTQEGVRGNEHLPTASHNVTLPFTRFITGAADYTFCYLNDNLENSSVEHETSYEPMRKKLLTLKVSKAHQLALSVIYYSPLQSIFWYGLPQDYTNEQDVEFFKHLPTTWDDTKVLKGEVGKFITVARKKAGVWYIGSATNEESRDYRYQLNFLEKGKRYTATIYSDFNGKISKTEMPVTSATIMKAEMKGSGGHAVIIR